jgi:uncharacterized membrane protein YgcG
MSEFWRRFDLGELVGVAEGPAIGLVEVARDLEAYAEIGWGSPTLSFEGRVMAAIAAEPAPRLRAELGPIATLREAWRLALSGGRPLMVRVQAMALVVTAAVALGAVGSLGLVAASRLFAPEPPTPIVQQSPVPTPSPSPTPSESPDASPSPSVSPDPASKRTPQPPPEETERPVGTDDGSRSGGSGGDDSGPGGSGGGEDDGSFGEPGSGEDSGSGSGGTNS